MPEESQENETTKKPSEATPKPDASKPGAQRKEASAGRKKEAVCVDEVAEAVALHPALQREPRLLTPSAQWSHYSRYVYLLSKLLFFGIILGIGVWLTQSLAAVLFPIFVSLLIAYLLDPGIDWLEGRRVNRTVGILLYIFLGVLAMAGMVLFLYPTIARLVMSLVHKAPGLFEMLQKEQIPWFERTFRVSIPPTFREAITEYSAQLEQALPGVIQKVGAWLSGILTQTGAIMSSLLNLVMIPVFSFYFLRDFDVMKRHSTVLLPAYRRDFLMNRLRKMDAVVGEWFRGQLQVAAILGVLYSIGLTAVFASVGIEWSSGVAVGVVVGILSIIPYFGVFIGVIMAALIVLIEWSGIGAVIAVGAVFMVVQLLEGYIITPKVVGEKVGLSPVVVIIVLLLGGELGGLMGILLSIPVAGALKVLLPDLIEYYQSTPFYTGTVERPAFTSTLDARTRPRFVNYADEAADGAVDEKAPAQPAPADAPPKSPTKEVAPSKTAGPMSDEKGASQPGFSADATPDVPVAEPEAD
ncbi:AI-2E family transporter [Bradymonas sediminis]|uniref:AI-2E family transporter n=1 Tax=Bradymonas sediminis TaxID=1548548 RepID=UPI0010E19BFB|nr:AI-2E family transporter [Bradymonas sediminis]TDP77587.1 putative PurR-regulated permease PerM [Bradymonas sediminis]